MKKQPSGKGRDRRKKKALTGPRKPARNRRAKRRGIVAARKSRREGFRTRLLRWSRRVDSAVDRQLRRAEPMVARVEPRLRRARATWSKRAVRWGKPVYVRGMAMVRWVGRRVRPFGILALRLLGAAERRLRSVLTASVRAATRAGAVLTPERGICLAIVAASVCLLASQFVDYRGVEVGQPGYSGLAGAAEAPRVAMKTPVDAHSYLLVLVALLGTVLGLAALRGGRRGAGRIVFGLGLLTVAVVLLIDRHTGLDVGSQASRFSGATAVLTEGFYAQLAAAAGMMVSGALLVYAPRGRTAKAVNHPGKRARKPSLARTQRGLASERT